MPIYVYQLPRGDDDSDLIGLQLVVTVIGGVQSTVMTVDWAGGFNRRQRQLGGFNRQQ